MNPLLHPNVALFSSSASLNRSQLQDIANALQIQQDRDFRPLWGRSAKLTVVDDLSKVPPGYYTEQFLDDIGEPGALGFHTDDNNQPAAFVDVTDQTSVTGSHELLEMAADPTGNRLVRVFLRGQWVLMLIEVCDPNEAETYKINGIEVSNFYRPEYLYDQTDPLPIPDFAYDFLGNNKRPLYVNEGGYCSYMVNGVWHQDTWFSGSAPSTRVLGDLKTVKGIPLRTQIDQYMMKHNWANTI